MVNYITSSFDFWQTLSCPLVMTIKRSFRSPFFVFMKHSLNSASDAIDRASFELVLVELKVALSS